MSIEDQLKKNGFVSTQGLSNWQEQQLQASVRKGEAMRLKNGVYAIWMHWQIRWWIFA
nr:hypothetical protein [Bacteroides stercorirosoris]